MQACGSNSSIVSHATRLRAAIQSTARMSSSSDASPRRKPVMITPVPIGLVRTRWSPGRAAALVRIRFGWIRPVTDRPYFSSSSRTVCPPTRVAPASLILLKPPSRILRSDALSMLRAGKLHRFMAVSGRPPMA